MANLITEIQSKETDPSHGEPLTWQGREDRSGQELQALAGSGPGTGRWVQLWHIGRAQQLNANSTQSVDMEYCPRVVGTQLAETRNARRVLRTGAVKDTQN